MKTRSDNTLLRMPAEWEWHEATWIGWPHELTDWPGKFGPIPWVYGELTKKITEGEKVRILVESKRHELRARGVLRRCGANISNVEFYRVPTNRGWTRDSGPMFVLSQSDGTVCIVEFGFTAWAKYPNWGKDARVPENVSRQLRIRREQVRFEGRPVVLEGGSIDVNGKGTILTTEECLLDDSTQVRNPGFERKDYERIFREYLGALNVIWLGKGIAGDDTHGHVDDLCRFVNDRTVVVCGEKNAGDANFEALCENRERLEGALLENGSRLEVVEFPMPSPVTFDGQRLPASYANFYFTNAAVLVPTFNDPNDRLALGILSELITDRPVVGIHAVDLVWGLGTLHCMTQQQPAS